MKLFTQNGIQGRLGNWLLFATGPSLVLSSNLKELYHHRSYDYEMPNRHTRLLLQSVHVHNFGRGEKVLVTLTYLTP